MAKRKIISIDEEKCTGCGECIPNCREGALKIIDGKARLVSDSLCDGLGACIGHCPFGAITIEEREAEAFGEDAVKTRTGHPKGRLDHSEHLACGCPGNHATAFEAGQNSELRQWPVQLHLISPRAPYFKGSDLLLAADCTAYALGGFHRDFLEGKSIAIACPKLDSGTEEYIEKISSLIDDAEISSITVLMMEVPCCRGLLTIAKDAMARSSRKIPLRPVIVSSRGEVLAKDL